MTPGTFLDPIALSIVGGGTILAAILRTPARDLARAIAALATLPRRRFAAEPLLQQIAALGRIARRHGAIALDRSVIADLDVAAAVADIVDGASPEAVATKLRHLRRARIERHVAAADAWAGMAEAAPAMGMVGTLIGLVAMFTQMTDPQAIGSAMAVALLATLYGALLSNLIALPIANRLRAAARHEAFERARIEEPLVALATREQPQNRQAPVTFAPLAEAAE
ncbi:MotA/TolQ/ExbB proton channel family protein [Sphingomonas sp. SUN019]|uniref:motility protein A n=1 Tax=Sphingomonas sp. SUN019 TaxID=2937788 RepID=UPI002164CEF7|nr:MotA/TolQ/ExbB proton channel family protein [Sphingomonas sp. SUN019]UVO51235.1 MotA/TolQ/ExbB proton channel family protein [Sphingomonas sp. SUN019]